MAISRDECPQLLSLAVHEFRTPVTVVAGYLRMLLKMQAGVGDQPRKLIEEAEKSCARLAALIAELGELSNFESQQIRLDRQDLDLFGLFAELAANVQEGADRDVRVELTQPAERIVVSGDRKYLARALETLLTATLRERAQPGVILGSTGVRPTANGPVAYIAMA